MYFLKIYARLHCEKDLLLEEVWVIGMWSQLVYSQGKEFCHGTYESGLVVHICAHLLYTLLICIIFFDG